LTPAAALPWFQRWPDLARWELKRFADRGLPAEVDSSFGEPFLVRSEVEFRGERLEIDVRYPSEYPELPPLVFARPGILDRHQHPFGGNFCLLEDPIDNWPGATWGAADLIAERLEALLADSERGPEAVRAAEAPMPEPHTAYYEHPFGAVVLVPGELASPTADEGDVFLRRFDANSPRWIVESIDDRRGDPRLIDLFPWTPPLRARWRRLDEPPPGPDGPAVAMWVRRSFPGLLHATVPPKLAKSRRMSAPVIEVVGLVFPEEGPGVGERRDGWLFVVVPRGNPPFLAHAQVVSPEERGRRLPELRTLAQSRAVIVGVGTLGAPVALELAKAGIGGLSIVDHDRYEANNSVRHILGIEYSGLGKAEAVANACQRLSPFCEVRSDDILFGQTHWEEASPVERLTAVLRTADVLIESTGSHQLQRFLARVAAENGLPFVSSWLTDGLFGAQVVRIVPGKTCCFVCFAEAETAGRLPRPEAGDGTLVTAQGCSHPTVPGAGFDATEAAAASARLAVQTMLKGVGYQDSPWDYAAFSFRRGAEDLLFPRANTIALAPTLGCARCTPSAG
jgi:hypothetical protein